MIWIYLNKRNIDYVKHNDLNGTKQKILTFTHKTHFHELRNTVYLCRLQLNYDSECKKLTRRNLMLYKTRFEKKQNFVFLYTKPLKYDTQAFHKGNLQMI